MPPTFGIEIEFIRPDRSQADIAAAIEAQGIGCAASGYTHRGTHTWKVVSDGSLGYGGHEVVSPVLTVDRLGEVDKVCAALSGLGATVSRACGLHVHVGAQNINVNALKRLAALYVESEDIIDQLLPPSRRASNNSYAQTVKNTDLQRLASASAVTEIAQAVSGGGRYSKLNFTAFWRHGTVEFRQHSGTIDPAKIKNWALFCGKMVETAEREQNEALQVVAPALPVTNTGEGLTRSNPVTNNYWRRGRRTRMIFQMLSRPEGATAEEVRVSLGVRATPDIRWHLNQARNWGDVLFMTHPSHPRGGTVFTLRERAQTPPPTARPRAPARPVAPTVTPITSLEALLAKLQMTPVEQTYWVERAAMLSPNRE